MLTVVYKSQYNDHIGLSQECKTCEHNLIKQNTVDAEERVLSYNSTYKSETEENKGKLTSKEHVMHCNLHMIYMYICVYGKFNAQVVISTAK